MLNVHVPDSFGEVCLEDLSEGLPVKLAVSTRRNSYRNAVYLEMLL